VSRLQVELHRLAALAGAVEGKGSPRQEVEELDAQRTLQESLVSQRTVVCEVMIVLAVFVGIAVWAIRLDE
jgi:hypothetical protein